MSDSPIIFIHYGDNDYLKYVLKSAKKFNEEIVLIGDKSNSKYSSIGIDHYHFDELLFGEKLEQFNHIYRRVGGEKFEKMNKSKGGKDWTKFNFQKWFVLKNFLVKRGIKSFWIFDSDTVLLDNLNNYGSLFDEFDYSTMNRTNQLQGKVNNIDVIDSFIEQTIDSFNNTKYLKDLKDREFRINPEWGFTMMRVFKILDEKEDFKTLRLKDASEEVVFDECICFSLGMEVGHKLESKRPVKRIYKQGNLFFEKSESGKLIKIVTINLSWVPNYFFSLFSWRNHEGNNKFKELNFRKDCKNLIGFYWDKIIWRMFH